MNENEEEIKKDKLALHYLALGTGFNIYEEVKLWAVSNLKQPVHN